MNASPITPRYFAGKLIFEENPTELNKPSCTNVDLNNNSNILDSIDLLSLPQKAQVLTCGRKRIKNANFNMSANIINARSLFDDNLLTIAAKYEDTNTVCNLLKIKGVDVNHANLNGDVFCR